MQVINRDEARSVSLHGLAVTPFIIRLMASFNQVNYTRTLSLEPDGSISDTLKPGGETGHFEGGFFHNYASWVITTFVFAPGSNLGFERQRPRVPLINPKLKQSIEDCAREMYAVTAQGDGFVPTRTGAPGTFHGSRIDKNGA